MLNMIDLTRHRPTAKAPKFKVGDEFGQLTIVEVLQYEARHLNRKQHWYRVECDCGNSEDVNQSNFKRKTCCKQCARSKATTTRKTGEWEIEVPSPDLDFARLKW